ncbi:MAG: ABC transporter permease [Chloroflexi bacterium]|nr:ABC transporter permease [Chloroflexota bacterium]
MNAQNKMPERRTLPPLELRGATPFGQTLALAARSAFASLGAHKLRAALTIIGIVVGIAGVFTIVNLASLARSENARGIGGLGANVIAISGFTVSSTAPPTAGSKFLVRASGAPSLTAADVQALQKLPYVVGVSPLTGNPMQIQAGDHNLNTAVFGGYPDIQITQGYSIQQGAFFSQADVNASGTVAVLGQTVAKELFPSGNAIGQQVRIGNVDFSVVGVLKPLGNNSKGDLREGSMAALPPDDIVVVPASTFSQRLMGSGGVRMTTGGPSQGAAPQGPPPDAAAIQVQGSANGALARTNFANVQVAVDDPKNVETVKQEITRALEQNHGIKPGSPDDFTVGGFLQGVAIVQQGATTIMWVMGIVAAIALLIGGFGVANVMLAAVAERRVEIGIRLAVGASVEDVFWQFLLEALTLSAAGGLLGILGGAALSLALPSLSPQFARMRVTLSWLDVVAALVAALAIGLAFGAYPARRAAGTDPIQALRRA